ncbi:hypothetical protein LCGC14_2457840 [marine sediment metagenome]|uniref:Uncharacterized protein n=1 Tax=marine sediment metagenome TaxID=412755 RepID=A0A0F9DRD1_9ZZZZ
MQQLDGQLVFSPSDLNNYLECRHLTQLDLAVANGELEPGEGRSKYSDLIARKGDEHEAAYLQSLKDAGKEVVELPSFNGTRSRADVAEATVEAIKAGAEVIYEAAFLGDGWGGYADFLLRTDRRSDLGDWSYEVADTKLARRTKPYFLLQLCLYGEQLARLQGLTPEWMHVILGSNERHRFRLAEFDAYYRKVKQRLLDEINASPLDTYPNPVSHCELCRWSEHCDQRRIDDDHLSLVAGMRSDQVIRLDGAGIPTLDALALAAPDTAVPRMAGTTFEKLRRQAALQLDQRKTDEPSYELLAPEEQRGLALLPPPSVGDLFFDIEGDPLYEDGLEYLFGVVAVDPAGNPSVDPETYAATQTATVAGTPKPPASIAADSYDSPTETLTLTLGLSPDDAAA